MSLFNRAVRPGPRVSPDAIERALAALGAQVEPDPLFRRRLRSEVLNRHVAARENLALPVRATHPGRRETGRLGRASLNASLVLATTAACFLAATQEALPGEALYGMKLRIERLRFEVVPDHLRADLVAYALAERIEEVGRLAAGGTWDPTLVPAIEHEFARLRVLMAASSAADEARIEGHLMAVAELLGTLPASARDAFRDVEAGVRRLGGAADDPSAGRDASSGPNDSDTNGVRDPGGQGGAAPTDDDDSSARDRSPRSEASARPEPARRPEQTERPEPARRPEQTERPEPARRPEPASRPDTPAKPASSAGANDDGASFGNQHDPP